MGETSEGRWAALGVDIIASRQNGKNGIIEARELYGCVILGESIIHTAQLFKTARESYNRLLSLIQMNDDVSDTLMMNVASPASGYEMQFRGGGRVQFIARSRTSGRGMSGDILVLDEAQDLNDDELGALLPTISASKNPQAWYLGTAPGPDSTVWHRRRKAGRVGDVKRRAFFEFSALPDASLDDLDALLAANPGFPVRPNPELVSEERESMSDEMFARERFGISPDLREGENAGDIDFARWLTLSDPDAQRGSEVAFGADIGEDRLAHIAVAWRRSDGVQVMLTDTGLSPLMTPDRLVDLVQRWKGRVMLGGPASVLEQNVPDSALMSSSDFAAACGVFDDMLAVGTIHHGNQPELNNAVREAKWRSAGSAGERAFRLKDSPSVGPLAAAVRALWGLQQAPPAEADFFLI